MPAINADKAVSQTTTVHATTINAILHSNDYVPLTPESLLFFCQSQLRTLDESIQKKMSGQNNLVALESKVNDVESALKRLGMDGDDKAAFDDAKKVGEVDGLISTAMTAASNAGDEELVKSLGKVQDMLHAGGDNLVTKNDIKEMCTVLDSATAACRSGAEISMIELQSLISKRATQLQLTTGMMNSVNEGHKNIAANIGR